MIKTWRHVVMAAGVLALAAPVFAQEHSLANVVVRHFRNVSGGTLTSHEAVAFSLTDGDLTTGSDDTVASNIGYLVTTTTTADVRTFAGVLVDGSCPDDTICRFAVAGPTLVRWAQATDAPAVVSTIGGAVGTTTVAGMLGAGTGAGVLLSLDTNSESACQNTAANGTAGGCDGELRWVFLRGQEP